MSRFQFRVIKWALKQWKKMRLKEMNKPIIIDGVDVSECCFFAKHYHEDAYEDDCVVDIDNYCCLTMNECNDLCYYKQLQQLKAENERLNRLTGIYSFRQMKKYKQALEDVREIASPHCSQCREIIEKINEVLKDE